MIQSKMTYDTNTKHIHIHMHIRIRIPTQTYIHTQTHAHTQTCIHTQTHAHTQTYIHTHTHTHESTNCLRVSLNLCPLSMLFHLTLAQIHLCIHTVVIIMYIYWYTSRAARGGGGSFKNRKRTGEIGCCESRMTKRKHWWIWLTAELSNWLPD